MGKSVAEVGDGAGDNDGEDPQTAAGYRKQKGEKERCRDEVRKQVEAVGVEGEGGDGAEPLAVEDFHRIATAGRKPAALPAPVTTLAVKQQQGEDDQQWHHLEKGGKAGGEIGSFRWRPVVRFQLVCRQLPLRLGQQTAPDEDREAAAAAGNHHPMGQRCRRQDKGGRVEAVALFDMAEENLVVTVCFWNGSILHTQLRVP